MLTKTLILAASLSIAAQAEPNTEPAPKKSVKAPLVKEKPDPTKSVTIEKSKTRQKAAPAARERSKKGSHTKEHRPSPPVKKDHSEKPVKTSSPKKEAKNATLEKARAEQEHLAVLNALATEKQKHNTHGLRSKIAKLKLEKELLTERLALAAAQEKSSHAEALAEFNTKKEQLTREASLAKLEAEKIGSELKALQAASSLKTTTMMAQISQIEATNKRDDYANAKPQYLDNPLKKNGTLVISDRRIAFNGPVTSKLADKVTERINYFNNKNSKKPIFIVIDDSPGGSVMAGYRILKSMEGSTSPVYVVVKSFAASMAATITTLAEKSFVYPNAIILHHQISQTFAFSSMNLTEQKENVDDLKKWWARLADPIAKKMGITSDEFIEMMYKKTVSGDWTEFGDDAVKLKWADHVVSRIHETSLLKNPDAKKPTPTTPARRSEIENGLTPAIDKNGNPYMILPRRNPKDVYMMHNPDGYYRFK